MWLRVTKYYLLLLSAILFSQRIYSQLYAARIGSPLNALLNISFGVGNDSTVTPGAPLPAGTTSFKYTTSLCPPEGYYTIARRTNIDGCFANT